MPESSPETEDQTAQAVPETADVESPAESSPADKGAKGDMLSAVKAALEPKEKSPDSSTQDQPAEEAEAKTSEKDDKAEAEDGDFTEEELAQLAKLKPKTAKRINDLLDLKRQHLAQIEAHGAEIETLKPKIQQFDSMVRFVEGAGLSVDEVNRGFDTMRNLKQDPLRAYEQLKPIFLQLQQMAGEILPEDLHNAVATGQLTEAHARELALARTQTALSNQRAQRFERQTQERQQTDAFEAQRQAAASRVTEWEKAQAKDPDWKLKQRRVTELIELELHRKQRQNPHYFPSPEDAVSMADKALKDVNAEMKRFAPKPKPVNSVHDVASTRNAAAPKTLLEAAKQGLAKAHAG